LVNRMNLVKLRFYMLGTLAVIFAVSTLAIAAVLSVLESFSWYSLLFTVLLFNLLQWLMAPYMVDLMYRNRHADPVQYSQLYAVVDRLAARSGIKTPDLMISEIPIPNAFAYGSPLTGSKVAVTKGLLSQLQFEEVEAVIGHEFGHLRHRDVQVMMIVSLLPSIFYILARYAMYSSYYGSRSRDSSRGGGGLALIGGVSMIVYFVLILFSLGLSRLREYYADQHSVDVVEDGARKLSEGLAKITIGTYRMWRTTGPQSYSGFKTLFISDPDRAAQDAERLSSQGMSDDDLVREISSRRLTAFDQFTEVFSTHPNIVKRINALRSQT